MDEMERRIRAAGEDLPAPSARATARAREAVLGAASREPVRGRSGRRSRRIAFLAVASLVVIGSFSAGFAVAEGRDPQVEPEGPGFLPASGWDVFSTGTTEPPQAPTAIAANVHLRPPDHVGGLPHETLRALGTDGVVIWATFYPAGEVETLDRQFPERSLPLRLGDAEPGGIEGQPDDVSARRLLARVGAYNLDVILFFGAMEPDPETLRAADEELGRLVVPEE
jgi:hypothetical protein